MEALSVPQVVQVAGGSSPRIGTPTPPFPDRPVPVGPLRDPRGLDV